jgi:hypothetical protein
MNMKGQISLNKLTLRKVIGRLLKTGSIFPEPYLFLSSITTLYNALMTSFVLSVRYLPPGHIRVSVMAALNAYEAAKHTLPPHWLYFLTLVFCPDNVNDLYLGVS